MTFALSVGKWGGFYFERSEMSWRLCLGCMAFTLLFEDLDVWLERYVSLSECHDEHYRDMLEELKENACLRAKLAAWDAWEHAWVFGGDAAYPGKAGVTDPRETLDALERLALGVPVEEAEDA